MAVRSRGRRAGGLVLLGALVLLILGRGLGLWSGGPGDGSDASGDGSAAAPGVDTASKPPDRPQESSPREEGVRQQTAEAPRNEPAPLPEVPAAAPRGETKPVTPPPFDDARSARCAFARHALADGRIADALVALDGLTEHDPDVATLRRTATQRLDAAFTELAQRLRSGEVHAAQKLLVRLLVPRQEQAVAAVDRWTAEKGLPSLTTDADASAGRAPAAANAPATEVGLRDRVVRLLGEGPRVRVIAETSAGVTVRSVGSDGVTFPTVPAFCVEPEAVTAAEAAELGLLAIAGGEQQLARLWCICGLLLAATPPERLARLRAML